MRAYELVLVFDPEESKVRKRIESKVKKRIESKGKLIEEKKWGLRELAYPLKSSLSGKKLKNADYLLLELEADSVAVADLGRDLKMEEGLLRFLIVRKEISERG